MKRIKIAPRNNWQKKVEEIGFSYHTINSIYWDESVCYEFSLKEIEQIEKATNVLWELCVNAVQFVIDNKLYEKFHIPNWVVPHIENSWENDDPSIYGRFDFSFENGIPKLLEFNADTPTSLFESAVVQWYWLQDFDNSKDQFNSIHDKLVDYWKYLKDYLHPSALYFSCVKDNMEDITNTEYLRDCAIQGGLLTKFVYMDEIGWDGFNSCFVDDLDNPIDNIFKLYPYEWLLNEQFGRNIIEDRRKAYWIEPSWKMILSNKAILPILWKLNPGHENLLESYFEQDKFMLNNSYARKPLLSREGANVQLLNYGTVITETNGEYGSEGFVYQKFCPLPNFEGNFPLVGSWIVGQESVGIGIRESQNLITDNLSKFVPHLIVD